MILNDEANSMNLKLLMIKNAPGDGSCWEEKFKNTFKI